VYAGYERVGSFTYLNVPFNFSKLKIYIPYSYLSVV